MLTLVKCSMTRSSEQLLIGRLLLSPSALCSSSFCSHSFQLYSSFLFFSLSSLFRSVFILSLSLFSSCQGLLARPRRHVRLICSELEQHCARPFPKSARACASAARRPARKQTQEEEGWGQEAAAAAFLGALMFFWGCLPFTSWLVHVRPAGFSQSDEPRSQAPPPR